MSWDDILVEVCGLVFHLADTAGLPKFLSHPEGGSSDSDICDSCKEFWFEASMEVYVKRYFEWCRRTGESCLQNNIAEIYLIMDRSEWCLSFLQYT